MQQEVYRMFGKQAFEHGIFYLYEDSLRFELSIGGSFIEMFHQALSKGMEILNDVFSETDDLQACLTFYGVKGLLGNLSIFKNLEALGIQLDKSVSNIWQEEIAKDDEFYDEYWKFKTFVMFPINKNKMLKLLWSAMASDFGIKPKVNASVYLFSPKLQILAHPYDDRGMDIIGNNFDEKKRIFDKFNHYLLDYDREMMNKSFLK